LAELIGAVGFIVLLFVCLRIFGSRRAAGGAPEPDGAAFSASEWGSGPVSLNAYWAPTDAGQRRGPTRTRAARKSEEEPEYRVHGSPSGNTTRWDPFDPSIERKERLRAARRERVDSGRDPKGYYGLLGLDPGASDRQIEVAFRARAVELHPDRFVNDPPRKRVAEERFKALNHAMQVLRDPVRRALYDSSGQTLSSEE
jgi:hypothetical protein